MAIVIDPLYPVAGDTITLSIDNPAGHEVAYFLSAVPTRSEAAYGILLDMAQAYGPTGNDGDDTTFTTVLLQRAIDSDSISAEFVPDVSGEYTFIAYDTRRVLGTPAYPGDPKGAIVQDLVSMQSTTIYVGESMDIPLLTSDGDGATLRFKVNNATIRGASLVDHRSDKAEVAAAQAAVTAALSACAGIAVASVGTALVTATNDLRTQYEAHRVRTAAFGPPFVHILADATNVVPRSAVSDEVGAMLLLNDLRDMLVAHMRDSSGSGVPWHAGSLDDLQNWPLAPKVSSRSSATVLCADLRWRAYNRHRLANVAGGVNPRVHTEADTTDALTVAVTPLDTVIVTFFDALVSIGNTAMQNENQGEVDLRALYGFERGS